MISRSVTSLQIPAAVSHLQVSALAIREETAITSDNLWLFFSPPSLLVAAGLRGVARHFSSFSQFATGLRLAKGGSKIS